MNKINYKDISVVVQGLVVGTDEKDSEKQYTKRCLESVRRNLPGAEIVLSSWEGSNVGGLDFDLFVESTPPEMLVMAWKENGDLKNMTVNHQILSTKNGLLKANRKYVLKIRSDLVLSSDNFLKYFEKFNKLNEAQFLEKKIVVLPTYNFRKHKNILFNVCDWLYFGLKKDLLDIFDIPFQDESNLKGEKLNGHYIIQNNFEAEQYIWSSFLKKHQSFEFPYYDFCSEELMEIAEESYARNLIMIPAQKLKVSCLKMPSAGYGARPILSQGLYTFNEFKKIHNKYNKNKFFIMPNPFEKIFYIIFYRLRFVIKNKMPNLYKNIVNLVRKIKGSHNLLKK